MINRYGRKQDGSGAKDFYRGSNQDEIRKKLLDNYQSPAIELKAMRIDSTVCHDFKAQLLGESPWLLAKIIPQHYYYYHYYQKQET